MHDLSSLLALIAITLFVLDRRFQKRAFFYGTIGAVIGMVVTSMIIDPMVTGVGLIILAAWFTIELAILVRMGKKCADELVAEVRSMPEPLKTRLIRFELTKRLGDAHPVVRQHAMRRLDREFPEPKETD